MRKKEKQRLNGSMTAAKNRFKKDKNNADLQMKLKKIENTRFLLNEYITNNENYIKDIKQQKEDAKWKNQPLSKVGMMDLAEWDKKRDEEDAELYKKVEEMTGSGIKGRGIIKKAKKERNRIKGYKADVTKKYNSGTILEAERQIMNKRLDDARAVLNEYIKDHKKKIKGRRRKQRGGNVMFFNDVKQLLNKLELIIGEIIAGNTSIQMRNTGVNILDTLLRISKINKPQYNKLYKKYFKV